MNDIITDRPIVGYQLFDTNDIFFGSGYFISNADGTYILYTPIFPIKVKLLLYDTFFITAQGIYELKLYKSYNQTIDNLILDEQLNLLSNLNTGSSLSELNESIEVTIVLNQLNNQPTTTTTSSISTTTTTTITTTTTSTTTTTTTTLIPYITINLSSEAILNDIPVIGYELADLNDYVVMSGLFEDNSDGSYIIPTRLIPAKLKISLQDTDFINAIGNYKVIMTSPDQEVLNEDIYISAVSIILTDFSDLTNKRNLDLTITQIS